VLVADLETEHVSWDVERADLAAAVTQNFVSPHGPADDFIEVLRGFLSALRQKDIGAPIRSIERLRAWEPIGGMAGVVLAMGCPAEVPGMICRVSMARLLRDLADVA
jgi:hypothetical protein